VNQKKKYKQSPVAPTLKTFIIITEITENVIKLVHYYICSGRIMATENKQPKEKRKIQLKLRLDSRLRIQIPTRIHTFKPKELVLVTIESVNEE
jgi:hypothetical protein